MQDPPTGAVSESEEQQLKCGLLVLDAWGSPGWNHKLLAGGFLSQTFKVWLGSLSSFLIVSD